MLKNRQFLLVRRPTGDPLEEDFELRESDLIATPEGGLLVRNHYVSLDPAQRGWMDDVPSYLPPIELGQPVRATTVGVVHESRNPDYKEGDWVLGLNAMEDYSVVQPSGFTNKIDVSGLPSPTLYLSALGAVGLTAYFGLLHDAEPVSGETVLVSGAAGAVGSMVGQIARINGCRTIGIAGGPDKCLRLTKDYGFDHAIDYRGKTVEQLSAKIAAVAPDGVDILFENVGGDILDASLMNLAMHARIVLCGLISEYNSEEKAGARNLWQLIVTRATMKGFLIADYADQFMDAAPAMAQWISEGKLRVDEDVQEGLENAYEAFMRLFSGANTGKLILKVA